MHVVSVMNQKGGVGKTTTTANLAAEASRNGIRTLMIDLDPQRNLTKFWVGSQVPQAGLFHVLTCESKLAEAALQVRENLWLLPSTPSTAKLGTALKDDPLGLSRLAYALADHQLWDLVFIDCPPSLDILPMSAIMASTNVLVPVKLGQWSADGFGSVLETVVSMSRASSARVDHIVPTMVDLRLMVHRDFLAKLEGNVAKIPWPTRLHEFVPATTEFEKAEALRKPISEQSPDGPGAQAYAKIARQLFADLGLATPLVVPA